MYFIYIAFILIVTKGVGLYYISPLRISRRYSPGVVYVILTFLTVINRISDFYNIGLSFVSVLGSIQGWSLQRQCITIGQYLSLRNSLA